MSNLSLPHVLGHAIWTMICGLLAMFHLRPLYAGYGLGSLILLVLIVSIYAQATGRVQFTFEPTEFQKLESDKSDGR